MKKVKRKVIVKKQVTITYCEYNDGVKSLKGRIPYEISKWIAWDYIQKLRDKDPYTK